MVNYKQRTIVEKVSEMERLKKQKLNRNSKAWDFGGIDENNDSKHKKKVGMNINDSLESSLQEEELKTEEDFFDIGRSQDGVPKSTG